MTRFRLSSVAMSLLLLAGVAALATRDAQAFDQEAPAQPSTPCVAIVLPSVRGADGDAVAMGESLRALIASYLNGPSIRSIDLEARLQSQAIEEARAKGCGHVLLTTVTRKRKESSALGRALGQAATTAVWQVPYGSSVGAAAARSAVISGAYAVSELSQGTRAKDELTIDYRIGPLDTAASATPSRVSEKARSDREDLLTPLVEQLATGVAALVQRSR